MRNSILFILLAGKISVVVAQAPATQPSAASSFTVEGIKVIYKPTVKKIINVSVYFRGGVTNYAADKAGIEKLAVHGATECGNSKLERSRFKDQTDLLGIEINGSAGLDDARISLNCISKYFNEGWELLKATVTQPVFEKSAFENMKQDMLGRISQSEGNPDLHLKEQALQNAFSGTPYAINPDGTGQTLSSLSAQEVKDYYFKTLLDKSRIFIVVVGNVPAEEIRSKISAAFASLPASGYHQTVGTTPVFLNNDIHVEERSIATNYISGIMNAPAFTSPDYVPFLLAFSELHGMLFTEIRIKRNLSYAPDANLHASLLPYSDVYVSTKDPREAVKVMANAIIRERQTTLINGALDQIKAIYITGSYRNEESTNDIAEGLGRAETLGNWEIFEALPDLVRRTTSEEMARAFKKYIGGIIWTYLGDKQKADDASDSFQIAVK